jgi:methylphosphotriester-DNA--protein-cysteine methyltransferase
MAKTKRWSIQSRRKGKKKSGAREAGEAAQARESKALIGRLLKDHQEELKSAEANEQELQLAARLAVSLASTREQFRAANGVTFRGAFAQDDAADDDQPMDESEDALRAAGFKHLPGQYDFLYRRDLQHERAEQAEKEEQRKVRAVSVS